MTKFEKVVLCISTILLAILMVGIGDAKWAGDIDLLYSRFVSAMIVFGITAVLMNKN